MGSFVAYHLSKSVLWRFGYFAKFFYNTRLLSIPVWGVAMWVNLMTKYPYDLKQAGVFEYNSRKVRLEKDLLVVK